MFDALRALVRDPAGLMKHLGYATGVPPLDESFPRRLARFGLLYLPRGLAEEVAVGEPFTITLDAVHLPNALAGAAAFGSGSAPVAAEPGGDAWQLGAVPAIVLVAALDRVASAVDQQLAETGRASGAPRSAARRAGSRTAREEVAEAQELVQTAGVKVRQLAGPGTGEEGESKQPFDHGPARAVVRAAQQSRMVGTRSAGGQGPDPAGNPLPGGGSCLRGRSAGSRACDGRPPARRHAR